MFKSVSSKLFTNVRVPLLYTLPIILAIFALSTGYIAIVLLEAAVPKDPLVMEVDVFTIYKLIRAIKILTIIYICFAALVGILISRTIHRTIASVVGSYENIKKGEPVAPVEVTYTGDEMEALASNFNLIVDRLNNYIYESMMGCTIVLDRNLNVLSLNAAARKTLYIEEHAEIHTDLNELINADNANEKLMTLLRATIDEQTVSSSKEVLYQPPFGAAITLGLTASILKSETKEAVGLFVVFKDLTKIKEMRLQIQRTEKMVSLGRMSAGIAHEIRNPLGSIKGLLQLLMEHAPDDEKVQRYTGVMIREVERLDNVVNDLLNFSTPVEREFEEHDINDLLREAVALARYQREEASARLEEHYDISAPPIMMEKEKLLQALLNILINAFQATKPSDTVTITSHFLPVRFHFGERENCDGVLVEITNTGSSIPHDTIEKIFDPFFTTKMEGSGLGLAITQQIVTSHGGNLKVVSGEDFTSFKMELPLTAAHV